MLLFPNITLQTTDTTMYKVRTQINASESDLTVYFVDPKHADSPGRQLTEKHSDRFIVVPLPCRNVDDVVRQIVAILSSIPLPVVNIAGNAIYRFPTSINQRDIDQQIYEIIDGVSKQKKIGILRSGGQTGGDWGGLVAAAMCNIPCTAVFPKGFRQRKRNRQDVESTEQQIRQMIEDSCQHLRQMEL